MKVFILLPSYNEGEALPHLLKSINKLVKGMDMEYEVVVINDGSEDETEDAAKKWADNMNINVINHERNMGLGEAVCTGLTYFYENCNEEDIAVVMDADNTHNPALIPSMAEEIRKGADVVIASRYQSGGREIGLSDFRKLCSLCINIILKLIFNVPNVKDYTCGYRTYSSRAVKSAYKTFASHFIEERGFTCMSEILVKLYFVGCSIKEVPLVLRYDMKKGKSKMKVVRTIIRYFYLIGNLRQYKHSFVSKPVYSDGKGK